MRTRKDCSWPLNYVQTSSWNHHLEKMRTHYRLWSGATHESTSRRNIVSYRLVNDNNECLKIIHYSSKSDSIFFIFWYILLEVSSKILICNTIRFQLVIDMICIESTGFAGFLWIWTWIIRELDVLAKNGKGHRVQREKYIYMHLPISIYKYWCCAVFFESKLSLLTTSISLTVKIEKCYFEA